MTEPSQEAIWFVFVSDGPLLSHFLPQGSLESWLLLRSLRTVKLRVLRQSKTSTGLAEWFKRASEIPKGQTWDGVPSGVIVKVWHSSLQPATKDFDPKAQMEGGFNATFSILLRDAQTANLLTQKVKYLVVRMI